VITVFLFDQSIFMGFYMLLVVTLLVTALIAFSRDQSVIPQWANLQKAGRNFNAGTATGPVMFFCFRAFPGHCGACLPMAQARAPVCRTPCHQVTSAN